MGSPQTMGSPRALYGFTSSIIWAHLNESHLEILTLHHAPLEPAHGVPVVRAPGRSDHLIT